MAKKIIAVIFIYLCAVLAWSILGASMSIRSKDQNMKLKGAVNNLGWSMQQQKAPVAYYEMVADNPGGLGKINKNTYIALESSAINVNLKLDYRQKGLLWYSTYHINFNGKYRVRNKTAETRDIIFSFPFPARNSIYDNFRFVVNGTEINDIGMNSGYIIRKVPLDPGHSAEYEINYISQGLDEWRYNFGDDVNQVRNFKLVLETDFDNFDFPENSMSPSEKQQIGKGWKLTWQYVNLLSGVNIGMIMPHLLNPGPWVADVTYSAPISLFLFFFLLFIFTTVKQIKIHSMNYFFIAAAFFSFHLLLAYLVDHLSIHISFIISSVVSIFLVVSYMRLVVDKRFAFVDIGISQFVYLVIFSYTFFFEGYTGLAITILCIITLFIIMQFTGRIDWGSLSRKPNSSQPPNQIYKQS
jgi:Inner membrane protein CreD